MGEAGRYPELVLTVFGEHLPHPLAEGGRHRQQRGQNGTSDLDSDATRASVEP